MKRHLKKSIMLTVTIMMLLALLALLTGCKGGDNGIDDTAGVQDEQSEYVYIATAITSLPSDLNISRIAYSEGKIYLTTQEMVHYDNENPFLFYNINDIYSMNDDGSELTKLEGYKPARQRPEDTAGTTLVNNIAVDSDGSIWIIEEWDFYEFDLPIGFDIENEIPWEHKVTLSSGILLRKLDPTGAELMSVDISSLQGEQEYFSVAAFAVYDSTDSIDANGSNSNAGEERYIYIGIGNDYDNQGTAVYVLDSSGGVQFEFDAEYDIRSFIKMPDGTIALALDWASSFSRSNEQMTLQVIDVSAKAPGQTIELPDLGHQTATRAADTNYHSSGALGSAYDLLISDGVGLYGYTVENEQTDELLKWMESCIEANFVQDIFAAENDSIICISRNLSADTEIITLTKTLRTEIPEKTVLTLAGFNIALQTKNAVTEFNRKNPEYCIEIKDYTGMDWSAGINRMITEISAGAAPDILDMTFTYISDVNLTDSGLFADIYELIDADPAFDRNDFMQAALRSCETDGKLYIAPTSFTIETLVGNPAVLGADMGWNIEEFNAALADNPNADIPLGGDFQTKDIFMQNALSVNMNRFINKDAGTTDFESKEFLQLLETANRLPGIVDVITATVGSVEGSTAREREFISEGRQLLIPIELKNFNDFQREAALGRTWLGGELVCKGYPNASKNGHIINTYEGFAIFDSSPNKEAAWAFVRTFLEKDRQSRSYNDGFPVNKEAFEQKLKMEQERRFGERFIIEGTLFDLEKTTGEQIDMILAIIESVSDAPSVSVDAALMNIVSENVSDYFSGKCSAEDAARVIQSRASIYVSERS